MTDIKCESCGRNDLVMFYLTPIKGRVKLWCNECLGGAMAWTWAGKVFIPADLMSEYRDLVGDERVVYFRRVT
jgi:hypothetical protein